MKNYWAFVQKELLEGVRTYKAIILIAVFLIFGIMSPLFAKLTPDILSSFASEGVTISMPDPTALDSWAQFFKNVSQMGFVVLVVLYSGILAQEVSRGTLINMLTKGLSRTAVICAKYSMLIAVWSVSYALCLLVTLSYTVYLFPACTVENLPFALIALWLFGVLLLSILILAASAARSNYSCLLATGLAVVIMTIANIAPDAHKFDPLSLAMDSTALTTGTSSPSDLMPAAIIALCCSCACLVGAVLIFRKRQL
jgi:ABC-2 type transport system permease protein